jgi:hypothetical protein
MKKVYWIIGSIVLVGTTVGVILVLNNRKKQQEELEKKKLLEEELTKKTEENNTRGYSPTVDTTPVDVNTVNVSVAPPIVTENLKVDSFNKLKKYLGKNFEDYGTYILYNTTQSKLGLGSGTAKVIVKFAKSGDFGVWLREIKTENRQAKGNFYNGGTKIVIYEGKNKGINITGANPINNIARAIA